MKGEDYTEQKGAVKESVSKKGPGTRCKKDMDTAETKTTAPPTPDHISVGGPKRERTVANLRSETEDDGKTPGAQEPEAASSGQRAQKGRKANVGLMEDEWNGEGAGCHRANA